MPSNQLILCCPLLLLPSIFPSIGVFSNEWALCIRWPKYWSFSFSIRLSNEYSGLTFFRTDWFDLLAIQGTLRSLLQHPNSTASTLQPSAFFMVQPSHPYLHAYLLSCVWLVVTTWTVVHQAPLSMLFSRQEYWSELPCPPPGNPPNPGIEPRSPALQADSLQSEPPGKPIHDYWRNHSFDYTDLCQKSDVFAF